MLITTKNKFYFDKIMYTTSIRKSKAESIPDAILIDDPSLTPTNDKNASLVIHEEEMEFSIRGVDDSIITPEKREILNDAEYFKQLSLSFYPKQKSQSATEKFLQSKIKEVPSSKHIMKSSTKSDPFVKTLKPNLVIKTEESDEEDRSNTKLLSPTYRFHTELDEDKNILNLKKYKESILTDNFLQEIRKTNLKNPRQKQVPVPTSQFEQLMKSAGFSPMDTPSNLPISNNDFTLSSSQITDESSIYHLRKSRGAFMDSSSKFPNHTKGAIANILIKKFQKGQLVSPNKIRELKDVKVNSTFNTTKIKIITPTNEDKQRQTFTRNFFGDLSLKSSKVNTPNKPINIKNQLSPREKKLVSPDKFRERLALTNIPKKVH